AFEVWTGAFQPDDEGALKMWDARVRQGWRTWANGGTDLHGVNNSEGFAVGTPTTVVYADRLSKTDIVAALRKGRSFVTRKPDGVELYLTGAASQGQHQIVGGTLYGAATDMGEVEVLVRRAAGMRLLILRDGVPLSVTPISTDAQTVTAAVPIGPVGGAVRVEVRSVPAIDPAAPRAGRTDMEAFTNPILLVNGPVPADAEPVFAPPGPPGPRRTAAAGANVDPNRSIDGAALPATGSAAGVALAVAGAAGAASALRRRVGAGDAVPMTITEFLVRASGDGGLAEVRVRLTGQITEEMSDGTRALTRWVPACCATHEAPVSLHARALDAPIGAWVEADGVLVEGTGQRGTAPVLDTARWRVLDEPLPRLEA
ncbi:MAG TPA: CehA/McbA family metallohydrolase, partial [Acidimicrobiales bacterium]|nr:CehA/McbA family metallohydrolase [Acidimicrobiales bacterium]